MYYSSFHSLFHYLNITPIYTEHIFQNQSPLPLEADLTYLGAAKERGASLKPPITKFLPAPKITSKSQKKRTYKDCCPCKPKPM